MSTLTSLCITSGQTEGQTAPLAAAESLVQATWPTSTTAASTQHDGKPYAVGKPMGIMLRCVDSIDNSPEGLTAYYQQAYNLQVPFALHVAQNGIIRQCAPLGRQTTHPPKADTTHLSVVLPSTFCAPHSHIMQAAQLGALVGLCAHLVQCGYIDPGLTPDWLSCDSNMQFWHHADNFARPPAELPQPTALVMPAALAPDELRALVLKQASRQPPVAGLDLLLDPATPGLTSHNLLQAASIQELSPQTQKLVQEVRDLYDLGHYTTAQHTLSIVDFNSKSFLDRAEMLLWSLILCQCRGKRLEASKLAPAVISLAQHIPNLVAQRRQLAYSYFQAGVNAFSLYEKAHEQPFRYPEQQLSTYKANAESFFSKALPYLNHVCTSPDYAAAEQNTMAHNIDFILTKKVTLGLATANLVDIAQSYHNLIPWRKAQIQDHAPQAKTRLGDTYMLLGAVLLQMHATNEGEKYIRKGAAYLLKNGGSLEVATTYLTLLQRHLQAAPASPV